MFNAEKKYPDDIMHCKDENSFSLEQAEFKMPPESK